MGQRQKRIHPVTGTLAIVRDSTLSIGYTLLRAITITLPPFLIIYFGISGLITIIVMSLEIVVLPLSFLKVRRKT
jgi:prepilin signal peptidase PulO-like enzyme (type II secretory pathway)